MTFVAFGMRGSGYVDDRGHDVRNVRELAGNTAGIFERGRPICDKGRSDSAFVSKMLVEQKGCVADICPGHTVALPNVVRSSVDRMIVVSNFDRFTVARSARDIVPSRIHYFRTRAIVRKKDHERFLSDAFPFQSIEDFPDTAV